MLSLQVARYAMNGTFLGLVDVKGGDLQFCKASQSILDAAFVFGTTYEREASFASSSMVPACGQNRKSIGLFAKYHDNNVRNTIFFISVYYFS